MNCQSNIKQVISATVGDLSLHETIQQSQSLIGLVLGSEKLRRDRLWLWLARTNKYFILDQLDICFSARIM